MPTLAGLAAGPAQAHSFGRIYNLPVPFWLYAWGAGAALVVSFLMVCWFVTGDAGAGAGAGPGSRSRSGADGTRPHPARPARTFRLRVVGPLLRVAGVLGLALCIAAGFLGTSNAYMNLNMTLFWIVFVLGFTYLVAVVGDLYPWLNPWRTLVWAARRVRPGAFRGRVRYPPALGVWPALGFYMAFIWLELFGDIHPFSLAVALSAYTAINLLGAWLVGASAWFAGAEFFGVFLGLVGRLAPLEVTGDVREAGGVGDGVDAPEDDTAAAGSPRVRWRAPFAGLLERPVAGWSELVFGLFMLSSTAFDGLRETQWWVRLFWMDFFRWAEPWVGSNIVGAIDVLLPLYLAWNTLVLVLSPFLYLAAYLAVMAGVRAVTRTSLSLRRLALGFGPSLLPIALVYNVTHYFTLLITQGVQLVHIVSDPLGRGWNLFGTAMFLRAPILSDMVKVWHVQVGLILLGHVIGVYAAHLEALRVFATRRRALVSQLPVLVLMLLFTTFGLWILAQPLNYGPIARVGPGS